LKLGKDAAKHQVIPSFLCPRKEACASSEAQKEWVHQTNICTSLSTDALSETPTKEAKEINHGT
jgi:hypothetical protein